MYTRADAATGVGQVWKPFPNDLTTGLCQDLLPGHSRASPSTSLPAMLTASLPCAISVTEQPGPCGCSRRPLGPHQRCHSSLGTVCALAATGPHGKGSFMGKVLPLALANCDGVIQLLLLLSGHLPVPGVLEWPHSPPVPPGPCSVCGHQASWLLQPWLSCRMLQQSWHPQLPVFPCPAGRGAVWREGNPPCLFLTSLCCRGKAGLRVQ